VGILSNKELSFGIGRNGGVLLLAIPYFITTTKMYLQQIQKSLNMMINYLLCFVLFVFRTKNQKDLFPCEIVLCNLQMMSLSDRTVSQYFTLRINSERSFCRLKQKNSFKSGLIFSPKKLINFLMNSQTQTPTTLQQSKNKACNKTASM
jgi:hypothetical protein